MSVAIIEAIRDFIKTCPLIDKNNRINVDYLGNEPIEYTIDPVPTTKRISTNIDGSSERQQLFNFASREYYSREVAQNIANSKFYEDFSEWLDEQSEKDILPNLGNGKTATRIEAVTSGYLYSTTTGLNNAKYNIQCRLVYDQE